VDEQIDRRRGPDAAYMRTYRQKRRERGGDEVSVMLSPEAAAALRTLTAGGAKRADAVSAALIAAAARRPNDFCEVLS
jgi:hypothetical protein